MVGVSIGTAFENMHKSRILLAAATLLTAASVAAMPIAYTFIADGVTENVAQQGTAVFAFDTTNLTTFSITLTDNVDPTAFIASELDGLRFTFSQAPTSLMLTNVIRLLGAVKNEMKDRGIDTRNRPLEERRGLLEAHLPSASVLRTSSSCAAAGAGRWSRPARSISTSRTPAVSRW